MPLARPAQTCPGCSELKVSEARCPCGYETPEETAARKRKEKALREAGVKPIIDIDLYSSHGNAFAIMGSVSKAMKEYGVDKETIARVMETAKSHDYEHLVRHLDKYVTLMPVGFSDLDEFFDHYNNVGTNPEYRVRGDVPPELQEAYKRDVMDALKGATT